MPTMVAMTAITLAHLSGDRFILGLGPSGPQVVEGWHGVWFSDFATSDAEPRHCSREFSFTRLDYGRELYIGGRIRV